MPDATDRVLWGSSTVGYLAEQLPNIQGTFYIDVYGGGGPTGAFSRDSNYSVPNHQNWAMEGWRMVFDASKYSSTYTDGGVVRPASLAVLVCIKY